MEVNRKTFQPQTWGLGHTLRWVRGSVSNGDEFGPVLIVPFRSSAGPGNLRSPYSFSEITTPIWETG
jgi:hypothetical protein